MYKIGDFSRLAQVSVRMLRHYDQIGLLTPNTIDSDSGYRYYSIKQLPTLTRIVVLKEMGFSLEQIKSQLTKEVSLHELKVMHQKKQAELEANLLHAQMQLDRIKHRLVQIENEGQEPIYDVSVKSTPAYRFVSIRDVVPRIEQMGKYCHDMHQKLYSLLRDANIKGPMTEVTFYHSQEYVETAIDVEMGVRIDTPLPDTLPTGLNVQTLAPVEKMATLIHKGPYVDIPAGVLALLSWIGFNGWQLDGAIREIHLSGPAHDKHGNVQSDPVSELQIPISMVDNSH